jgi:chromosome segregation protein
MYLKQLKLAGFKSFIDPITIPFPSQLVAVVGPNGCGKSNIIDAVRWVLGESSAKNLRGDSMVDVIFNGSAHKKPLGQASVELVFDNSMGRLTGQYAAYQEVAIKRVVTREGESAYFLNGTRCRRRDITDLFLGTGAGTKGYSIIGQGTISKIVEAKPEELRLFFEEAAGISKYKERRKETLSRIEQSKQNISRITDIREELNKQIQRLEKQAKSAKYYQELKRKEKLCKAEIMALKWEIYNQEKDILEQDIQKLSLILEQHQAQSAQALLQSTNVNEQIQSAQEIFQNYQTRFYQLATEIARLEELAQQREKEKQRLQLDKQQSEEELQSLQSQLVGYQNLLETNLVNQANLEEQIKQQKIELEIEQESLVDIEKDHKIKQGEWNRLNMTVNDLRRDVEVNEAKRQQCCLSIQNFHIRLEKIEQELSETNNINGQHILKESLQKLQEARQTLLNVSNQASILFNQTQLSTHKEELLDIEKKMHAQQDIVHKIKIEQSGLEAQIRALRNNQEESVFWADKPRLIEALVVEEEWQWICEWIIGNHLQAVVVDSLDEYWSEFLQKSSCPAMVLTNQNTELNNLPYPRLSQKISGINPGYLPKLDHIVTAPNLDIARKWLPSIADHESIITPDGYWLGKGWLRMAQARKPKETGLIALQQQLKICAKDMQKEQDSLNLMQTKRNSLHEKIAVLEQQLQNDKKQEVEQQEQLRQYDKQIAIQEQQLQQKIWTSARLEEEKESILIQLENLSLEQATLQENAKRAQERLFIYEMEQAQLSENKEKVEHELQLRCNAVEQNKTLLHQTQLQLAYELAQVQQRKDNLHKEQKRKDSLQTKLKVIVQNYGDLQQMENDLGNTLPEKQIEYKTLEKQMQNQQLELAELKQTLKVEETKISAEEASCKPLQESIQQKQLALQTVIVRGDDLFQELRHLNLDPAVLLESISTNFTLGAANNASMPTPLTAMPSSRGLSVGSTRTCQHILECLEQSLINLVEKIKKLGAINLAAIEEYQIELQRKQYLDSQHEDLTEALSMLHAAIDKMDKETRQRLEQTFEEINEAFQALFPRLFGGGRAKLELTSDNWLETGIIVMAQPPGKRNSTIHLLSGGEKAMTAVALVFAIFQLNPSPFCMLDEVDAPLDEINIGRFCALVKEMSSMVQFLFITHNKITMELAEHLIGVTMGDPGVSQVVTVDVEQALAVSS